MNRRWVLLLISTLLGVFFYACRGPKELSRQNLLWLYTSSAQNINPQYVVYNSGADSSTVYFAIMPSELLFAKNGSAFSAKVKIRYRLLNSYDDATIADSSSAIFTFKEPTDTLTPLYGLFKIKIATGSKLIADIVFTDLLRGKNRRTLLDIDKRDNSAQNYMLVDNITGQPVAAHTLKKGTQFIIKHTDTTRTALFIKYYGGEFGPALPPFSDQRPVEPGKPDTTWRIDMARGYSAPQQWVSQGLYVLVPDSSLNTGLPVLRAYDDFPELTTPEDILKPLRYLVSKKEYDGMAASKDIKKAVDEFWLQSGQSAVKVRAVIKNYYSGVRHANDLFSTSREGWKTDRGMVFSVFGQPLAVTRSGGVETWLYNNAGDRNSTAFIFNRQPDGLGGYDYYLRRSDLLKPAWYIMLENWRNAKMVYWY